MKSKHIKVVSILILVLNAGWMRAETEASTMDNIMDWAMNNIIAVFAGGVILGAFITLSTLLNNLLTNQRRDLLIQQGVDVEALEAKSGPSFFKRMYDKASGLIPMEKESDIDLGHDYDGIRELDNRLPPWWLYLFYFTIGWAILYLYVSHFREDSVSQKEEYYAEMEQAEEAKAEYLLRQANSVDESNVVFLTDAGDLESGKKTYMTNCVACHGALGEGGVGPNFTDKYYIHGGSAKDMFTTVKYGVPEKGMQAWKAQMSPSTMQKVISFIKTLEGTNAPNGKEPQGELYEEDSQLTMNSEEEKSEENKE